MAEPQFNTISQSFKHIENPPEPQVARRIAEYGNYIIDVCGGTIVEAQTSETPQVEPRFETTIVAQLPVSASGVATQDPKTTETGPRRINLDDWAHPN